MSYYLGQGGSRSDKKGFRFCTYVVDKFNKIHWGLNEECEKKESRIFARTVEIMMLPST